MEELANRHLGHKFVKTPIATTTRISDINESAFNTFGVTQIKETLYDDMSVDRVHHTTQADEIVDTTINFLPNEDGILQTFIDRYTTMLIHDSIFMEELPAPQFMHERFSMLHPAVAGGLKHDPREMPHHQERTYASEQPVYESLSLEQLLRESG